MSEQKNIRQFRSTLKAMISMIDVFKRNKIHEDYINAVKETAFGEIFMAFYDQKFGKVNKGFKLNTAIIKILEKYDEKNQRYVIGTRSLQITEDVALTFGLSRRGVDIIQNKRRRNVGKGFLKHYFGGIKDMSRGSIENAIDKFMTSKGRRVLLKMKEDEKNEIWDVYVLDGEIKDEHRLAAFDFTTLMILYMACTIFFASSSNKLSWYLVEEIVCRVRLQAINWAKAVHEYLNSSIHKFAMSNSTEIMG